MSKNPNQLLSAIQQGNEEAFKQLFQDLYVALYRHAYTYVRDQQVGEELVQDAFVNLWLARRRLIISTSLEAYLFTSVRNLSLNYLKSRYAKQRVLTEEVTDQIITNDDTTKFSDVQELKRVLDEAIKSLPERCRIIFNLSRHSGMTYQEIADELGIGKESVKSQIKIAMHKLRHFLQENWED